MVRAYRESNVAALSARAANTGGTMQGEAKAEAALCARDIATFMKTIDGSPIMVSGVIPSHSAPPRS